MATMTLADMLASGAQGRDPLTHAIAREFVVRDQFSGILPVVQIPGTKYTFRQEQTRPTAAVLHNRGNTSASSNITTKVTLEVGRLYSEPDLDDKEVIASDLADAWFEQYRGGGWQIQDTWRAKLAEGAAQTTASDGNIKGLKAMVDATGFPATQKYRPATNTTGRTLALVDLDILKKKVKYRPDFFVMPEALYIDYKVLALASGNGLQEIEMPFARFSDFGYEIDTRMVAAYDGVPIFLNDNIAVESTAGKTGKLRIYCGTLEPDKGLEIFYPEDTNLGLTIDPIARRPGTGRKFSLMQMFAGLALRSELGLSVMTNIKVTNPGGTTV